MRSLLLLFSASFSAAQVARPFEAKSFKSSGPNKVNGSPVHLQLSTLLAANDSGIMWPAKILKMI